MHSSEDIRDRATCYARPAVTQRRPVGAGSRRGRTTLLPAIFSCVWLAACATPAQNAERVADFITANFSAPCERLGYARDSDPHRDCMVSMYQAMVINNATPIPVPEPLPTGRRRRR